MPTQFTEPEWRGAFVPEQASLARSLDQPRAPRPIDRVHPGFAAFVIVVAGFMFVLGLGIVIGLLIGGWKHAQF